MQHYPSSSTPLHSMQQYSSTPLHSMQQYCRRREVLLVLMRHTDSLGDDRAALLADHQVPHHLMQPLYFTD